MTVPLPAPPPSGDGTGADDDGAFVAGRWQPTWSMVTAVLAGLVLLSLGLFAGRADVALLGAGPVLVVAWALRGTVSGAVRASVVHVPAEQQDDPEEALPGLAVSVRLTAPRGAGVRVRVSRPGSTPAEAFVLSDGERRELAVWTPSVHTGRQQLFTVDFQGVGRGGALVAEPGRVDPDTVLVLPVARALPRLPLPFRLRGLTGSHASRRPGDGGELRDVHPFTPGDKLRRIDWRLTAKRSPDLSELYVRRSFADADAVVILVVDARDDAGPDVSTWSGALAVRPDERTSLDLMREAATSFARAAVSGGDRIGLHDLGTPGRPLLPGTGRRQLDKITWRLTTSAPSGRALDRVRAPQLPSGALVVLFSTFLDPAAADIAGQWRHSGHRVVAVDVLPPLQSAHLTAREQIAARMVRIERTDRLVALAQRGVEIFSWVPGGPVGPGIGTAAPEVELQGLARRSHRQPGVQVGR